MNKKQIVYLIQNPRQKEMINMCNRKDCDGCCDDVIFTKREYAENWRDGALNKHYKIIEAELNLTKIYVKEI